MPSRAGCLVPSRSARRNAVEGKRAILAQIDETVVQLAAALRRGDVDGVFSSAKAIRGAKQVRLGASDAVGSPIPLLKIHIVGDPTTEDTNSRMLWEWHPAHLRLRVSARVFAPVCD